MRNKGNRILNGRTIIDGPLDGASNMARDWELAEWSARHQSIVLRIYEWNEPTLSLGYFQNHSERERFPSLAKLPWVRRTSGGGAIVHHFEWTYSIAWPLVTGKGALPELYRAIHQGIVQWLKLHSLDASLAEANSGEGCSTLSHEKFLCFERRCGVDIVSEGYKILGSAQRRLDGALSQHGSLILRRSPFAPHLRGVGDLLELRGESLDRVAKEDFATVLRTSLSGLIPVDWTSETIDLTEGGNRSYSRQFESGSAWNLKR